MEDFYRVKHSFNAGDLIVLLAGIKHLYEDQGKKTKLYQRINFEGTYYHGQAISMTQEMFDMLHPLISVQDYIESFEVWQGQEVDFDVDLTRDSRWIPMPNGSIHHWPWMLEPSMACDLSKPWIKRPISNRDQVLIINRTERYNNPYITYFFLKDYEKHIVFSGTPKEHEVFCMQNNLNIRHLQVNSFLELVHRIADCKFFIGNQSFNWHLADAMKVPRILELCPAFPNTYPTGANGYCFDRQKSFQYYFEKLINEGTR